MDITVRLRHHRRLRNRLFGSGLTVRVIRPSSSRILDIVQDLKRTYHPLPLIQDRIYSHSSLTVIVNSTFQKYVRVFRDQRAFNIESFSHRDIKIVGRSIWRSSNEKTQVYAWHKRFSGGRDSIKDDVRSGRPTTATNEAIAQRVRNVVRTTDVKP
ncbi:hypothetical protein ANN_09591 [Periplaneta americana]|uniref:Uncharacterized protein n=1 Tax=Periplaneta americana TaxID=6978 RepID=A0ABQ8TM26_PERAM|nr:hypothetical protein ANN_09591 [Periplaneta americana]